MVGGGPFSALPDDDGIPATEAYLRSPNGVFVDSSGDIYIAVGEARIRKVSYEGVTIPDIKANGSDGPVTLGTSETLSVSISLTAGSNLGVDCDWWVAVNTPFAPPNDWFHYDLSSGWIPGLFFTYQGPLSDLGTFTVLNTAGLPAGTYKFYFAIDTNMNGTTRFLLNCILIV